nr:hypothetical protein Iba_chr07dCG1960 [Ipomoea batatas]
MGSREGLLHHQRQSHGGPPGFRRREIPRLQLRRVQPRHRQPVLAKDAEVRRDGVAVVAEARETQTPPRVGGGDQPERALHAGHQLFFVGENRGHERVVPAVNVEFDREDCGGEAVQV